MSVIKHSVGVVQGYGRGQLGSDVSNLVRAYRDYKTNDITYTLVGQACEAVLPSVEAKLEELFKKLKSLVSDQVVVEVQRKNKDGSTYMEDANGCSFKMGPLKKVDRVMQKAVHYAVCEDDLDTIQIQKVRDILRGTMVFPNAAWSIDGIGSAFIDAANAKFPGKVVQVKNRFLETRYPNLAPLAYLDLTKDLIEDIEWLFKQTLFGRDTFYRDMQLLILIDNETYPNGKDMKHTILELQLASAEMYGAKVFKTEDNGSGHDMYKTVRAVMEFCEFLYWTKKRNKTPQLKGAKAYYNVTPDQWASFAKAVETMYGLYRSKTGKGLADKLAKAIDDSEWYKGLTANAK